MNIPSKIFISIIFFTFASCLEKNELQDGDIIFHRSQSRQAKAISLATRSDYTHMGIIFINDGKPYVYEAIQPITCTSLDKWIERGVGKRYVIKRLKDSENVDFAKVKSEVQKFMGKSYDWTFEWSDEKIYCSELVWKAYNKGASIQIGTLKKLKQFDLDSPVVQKIMQDRYGKKRPFEMDVIAPSDMFESTKLRTIQRKIF